MTKPRVLVVADYYLPGFRAGGPVQAISNTVRRLASDLDVFIVTPRCPMARSTATSKRAAGRASAILVAQWWQMRAVREEVPLEFAGIPPKLDPVA